MSKPRSGAPRRVAVGLLAGALAVFGIALAPQAGATSTVTTERLAGTTRYGTAQAIAVHASYGSPTGAIVATGQNFPDALAASTLSGANGPAPIVLTETNNYTAEAKAALLALKAKTPSVTAVTIVGGTSAVSADVEASIKADGFTVTRTAGTTRYETAAAIATAANTKQTGGSGLVGGKKTAIFATGENFPDALAGGPMAYRNDLPLLLVTATAVPQATQDAISTLKITKALILGGTTAISNDVQTQLSTLTGDTAPTRLAGSNRNATAAAIGDYEIGTLAFPATSAMLATGLNFPDALAAGPFAGVQGAPIVLTASLPAESSAFLDKYSYLISKLWVSGGTSAIDDATVAAAVTAAQTISNDVSATDAPELLRVEAAGTGSNSGSVFRFVFDEPVTTTITAANFKAWTPYGEVTAAPAASARDSANTSAVLIEFQSTDATKIAESTVFTVANGAVQDTDAVSNPEGEANGPAARTYAAGITRNPDLTGVAINSAATTANTSYDFTFDASVSVTDATKFRMVDTDGAERTSTAAALVSGSTTVVRATFPSPAGTATGARGAALAGAVTSTTGSFTNPAYAITFGGSTDSPDLTSVTLDTTAGNAVTFVFDEAVQTLGTSGNRLAFHVNYRTTSGTTAVATSINAERQSSLNTVIATFNPGEINSLVSAGWVETGAVARPGGITGKTDAKGVASTFAAGAFMGPQLVSATRTAVTDLTGAVTERRIDFVFDKAITTSNAAGDYAVYSATGSRTSLGGGAAKNTAATAGLCSILATDTTNKTVRCAVVTTAGGGDTTNNTAATAIAGARLVGIKSGVVTMTTATQYQAPNGTTYATSNHEEKSSI